MQEDSQRPVYRLISIYAESHRNPTNDVIHFIWALHPLAAVAVMLLSLVYYFVLSPPFGVGMLLMSGAMLWVLTMLPQAQVLPISVAVFGMAWIGQFIGHKIEGKKPTFFDDLRFLLIGPLFVLSFLYRRLSISY
jgi:uncharacterized membrane protein YGL010W